MLLELNNKIYLKTCELYFEVTMSSLIPTHSLIPTQLPPPLWKPNQIALETKSIADKISLIYISIIK